MVKIAWKCVIFTEMGRTIPEGWENVTYRRGCGGAGTEKIRTFR